VGNRRAAIANYFDPPYLGVRRQDNSWYTQALAAGADRLTASGAPEPSLRHALHRHWRYAPSALHVIAPRWPRHAA